MSWYYENELGDHNLVQVYLMSCYLYEHLCCQVIDDSEFDELCQLIDLSWDDIDHPHKHLIDRDALDSATASYLQEDDFTSMIKGAAIRWLKTYTNEEPLI